MKENYLLKTKNAEKLYRAVAELPIIDYHNHVSVADIALDKRFESLHELWIASDPYKHRLMRICGVDERFITGDAAPREKFRKYCEIFPYTAGNPVYDWSRIELSRIFGISELPSAESADRIYDECGEMLRSPEFSYNAILSKFNIEYQSPVATLLDDLSYFDGGRDVPSLRADNLLEPSENLISELSKKTKIAINDKASYLEAISHRLDDFHSVGCRFADHALDSDFFEKDEDGEKQQLLIHLGNEYKKRGWTLLLHVDAKRATSSRLARLAGPAGGYAAVGGSFPVSKLCDLLGKMESADSLPDVVLFPLNMGDQATMSVMQGSFSEDGTPSKIQLGPAWWWCDHAFGIENTLNCIASFGAVSQFIGMTTDSRSILSFVRHDYFRRIFCSWLDRQNEAGEWELPFEMQREIATKICYQNAKDKIYRGKKLEI